MESIESRNASLEAKVCQLECEIAQLMCTEDGTLRDLDEAESKRIALLEGTIGWLKYRMTKKPEPLLNKCESKTIKPCGEGQILLNLVNVRYCKPEPKPVEHMSLAEYNTRKFTKMWSNFMADGAVNAMKSFVFNMEKDKKCA